MPRNKMKYPRFGKTGLRTSQVILGCMGFGSSGWQPWVLDEAEALPLLAYAWERGLTTWDTADVYSNGRSEEIIGEAIRQYGIPREELVILSKCYFAVQPGYSAAHTTRDPAEANPRLINQIGLSRKHILAAVDASVERLGTYIDVLQIHRLDQDTPREEIMRALNDVVESGKVRYLGASSMPAWEFQALQNMAERHGWHKFVSMQNYHHLLYREEEREMMPYCQHTGVAVIPWSPVAHGVLTRPWGERAVQQETDNHLMKLIRSCETEIDKAIVNRVEELARRLGVSMMGVVTAWSIAKGVTPIIGLSSKERIDQAVNNIHIRLSDEQIQYLEELYVPKPVQDY